MPSSFFDSIKAELTSRMGTLIGTALAAVTGGGLLYLDPFYHPGWALSNSGWLGFLLAAGVISIVACYWTTGLIVVAVIALIDAGAFGYLYRNPDFHHGDWPFYTWLCHLMFIALFVGTVMGLTNFLINRRVPKAIAARKKK
jgi:hypothetical protein